MTEILRPAHGYAKSAAMPTDPTASKTPVRNAEGNQPAPKQPLTLAAERALAEAAARRRAERHHQPPERPKEIRGRDGPDPTGYGDWEVNGLTSDF